MLDSTIDAPRSVLAHAPADFRNDHADVVIVGGGVAGLAAALEAAAVAADVLILTRTPLPESNSAWAQGGVAAALDADDSPAAHVADTLVAGAGLSDRPVAEVLATEAPDLMRAMADIGVPFEREGAAFTLGLEGGHGHRRILHVGDATGWALTSALIERVRAHPRIRVQQGAQVVDLLGDGRCTGVLALAGDGTWQRISAGATVLATGGAGALYGISSNPPFALGEGVALAYRAGAQVADMEFVQFHPTVFRTAGGAGFLITEAARGEGALLRDCNGQRFMPQFDKRAELAPRDVVARGIFAAMRATGVDHVLLDMTHIPETRLQQRFPTVYARCVAEGINPATQPIPVAPAAHFLMGGIRTDMGGATAVAGLYAAGECACTGVHGANRLASNSLLECLVFGRRAGAAAAREKKHAVPFAPTFHQDAAVAGVAPAGSPDGWRETLAGVLRTDVAMERSAAGLQDALDALAAFPTQVIDLTPDAITCANAALVARLITNGALLREESRGAHFRTDFPDTDGRWQAHIVQQLGAAPTVVAQLADQHVPIAA